MEYNKNFEIPMCEQIHNKATCSEPLNSIIIKNTSLTSFRVKISIFNVVTINNSVIRNK